MLVVLFYLSMTDRHYGELDVDMVDISLTSEITSLTTVKNVSVCLCDRHFLELAMTQQQHNHMVCETFSVRPMQVFSIL